MYLFPIAALLLLLSGVGTSAQAAGTRTAAAIVRGLWGESGAALSRTHSRADAARPDIRFAHASSLRAHIVQAQARVVAAGLSHSDAPRWAQRQYRTRFDCAGSAYLALGPPQSLSASGLRWL